MIETEWRALRNKKLEDISERMRRTMVTLCMMCKTGASVRSASQSLIYWVDDYATFLDDNILEEEDNERHGERDGVCDGGCPDLETNQGSQSAPTELGSGEGEKSSAAEGGKEHAGCAQGDQQSKGFVRARGDSPEEGAVEVGGDRH
ncbi:hypothetical protein C9890_0442 [Perkinsus sp. BL_2016]|nr:hypothetical protein C9890_0442 [Perkinsus sp. BL_2016]